MAWTEKLPSGRYRGGYRIPSGQKRYTDDTYTRKTDAKNAAAALEHESREFGWRDPRAAARPWGEWADEWFPKRVVEASTRRKDESRLKQLRAKWGQTPLHEITRQEVKNWAAEMIAEGKAHATVMRHLSLLSASLTAAADAEVIPANPALRMKLGLVQGQNERTLTREEQHRLFMAFDPGPGATEQEQAIAARDQALVAVLLGTGPRWGEAVALAGYHFADGEIRYRRAWDNDNREMKEYTKGKTRRSVPYASWLHELIAPALEANPKGLLFTDRAGTPLDRSNWRRDSWDPAIRRAGLNQGEHDDRVTIHTLRHTYATEQLEDGRTLGEIADLLGHASMAMAERYAHRRSQVNPDAANAIRDPRIAPPTDEGPLPNNVTRLDAWRRA